METRTYFLTKGKLKELKKEYEGLLVLERDKTGQEGAPKLFESENLNPDFVNFQEDMNFLRGRIDELRDIMDNHIIVKKPCKEKRNIVDLGARVKIDVDGKKDEFTIVGTLEANPAIGKISNESPVGRALVGKKVGDEVAILSPVKTIYKIKSIKYEIS